MELLRCGVLSLGGAMRRRDFIAVAGSTVIPCSVSTIATTTTGKAFLSPSRLVVRAANNREALMRRADELGVSLVISSDHDGAIGTQQGFQYPSDKLLSLSRRKNTRIRF